MPNEKIIELEKKIEKLRSEPESSELVIALNDIAYACIHSDPKKSEAYSLEAFNLASELGIPDEQARSNLMQGLFHLEAGNFAEALSQCRYAMDIYESLEDKKGIVEILSAVTIHE